MSTSVITILCTFPNSQEAETIVNALLEGRMVTCAHMFSPGVSKFWWKGQIQTAQEVYVLLKTRAGKYAIVERTIKRMHSYEVPCIVSYEIMEGSAPFLNWVRGEAF